MRALALLAVIGLVAGDGLRLPDQQSSNNIQQIYAPQPQQQQQQQFQQPQPPQPVGQPGVGEERGRSSILSIFGLGSGNDNDPYLARTNGNCLGGDLAECFKTQALGTFDEIFYKDQYR